MLLSPGGTLGVSLELGAYQIRSNEGKGSAGHIRAAGILIGNRRADISREGEAIAAR